jgi:putative transcriptional regulator
LAYSDEVDSMDKRQSRLTEAARSKASGKRSAQVPDQVTLRELDPLLLVPIEPLEPTEIKRIREETHVSQAVFARLLNTSVSAVQKWEIGQKRPAGTALKLLRLVQKHGLSVFV